MIHDLMQKQTGSVHYMRVLNTSPERYLQDAQLAKKEIYLEDFLQQHQHFSRFFDYVDGLLGLKVEATMERIASCLAKKWQKPYSRMCEYNKSRIAITLVWATHQCIWGYRVPACLISIKHLQWEDGMVLNLFQQARPKITKNGKTFTKFYQTDILGRTNLVDQKQKSGIRTQPIKWTHILQAQ